MKTEEIRNIIQEEIEVYTELAKERRVAWYQKKGVDIHDDDYEASENYKDSAYTLTHLMRTLGFINNDQEDELVKLIASVVISDAHKEFMASIGE